MPYLIWLGVGALAGAGTTYALSDGVKSAVKWAAIGGVAYMVLKARKG